MLTNACILTKAEIAVIKLVRCRRMNLKVTFTNSNASTRKQASIAMEGEVHIENTQIITKSIPIKLAVAKPVPRIWREKFEEVVDEANEEGMSVQSIIFDALYIEIATMLDMDTVKRFRIKLPQALQ